MTEKPAQRQKSDRSFGAGGERLRMFATIVQQRFKEDQNFQQAAALAYNTLFSLLPTLVLGLLVLSIISGPARRPTSITTATTSAPASEPDATLPSGASTAPAANNGDATLTSPPPTPAQATEEDTESIGYKAQEWVLQQLGLDQIKIRVVHKGVPQDIHLSTLIGERIESVRRLVQSPGTGLIAFAVLLYGVLSLMLVVERAFNHIFRASKTRPWARRFALYTCLFVWGPLGLAASIVLSQFFHGAAGSVTTHLQAITAPLSLLAGLVVSWFLLVIMYKLIPETQVRWTSAAIGALVGGVLWELGKFGFGVYLRFSVGTRNWYGGIALVPLFMLWIYLTWNFVLLGLQVAYIHQYFGPLAQRVRQTSSFRIPIVDVRWMLPLGVALYRSFKAGVALEPEAAALAIGAPPDVAGVLLKGLQQAGLAHAVGDGTDGYVLSQPPEQITAAALLAAGAGLAQLAAGGTPGAPREGQRTSLPESSTISTTGLDEFDELQRQWGQSRNLVQLAREA